MDASQKPITLLVMVEGNSPSRIHVPELELLKFATLPRTKHQDASSRCGTAQCECYDGSAERLPP
jgi:hypothetical protein